MTALSRTLARGVIAGAAATTALNAVTYLDMTLRGRPASQTPSNVVEKLAGLIGTSIPGDEKQQANRKSGLGALLGLASGTAAGIALSGLRTAGRPRSRTGTLATAWLVAMIAGNGPMTALGVTDPRNWSTKEWAADIVPHLAYALTATTAISALDPQQS